MTRATRALLLVERPSFENRTIITPFKEPLKSLRGCKYKPHYQTFQIFFFNRFKERFAVKRMQK
jgi:hypothetical protein